MLDPFYKSFYLFLIFYSICLDPTGYIHRIRMKEANSICYIIYCQAPAIKKGFVKFWVSSSCQLKVCSTSCYRSIKEQIISTSLRKSCVFPHLNSANRLLGKVLQNGFIHRSMHLYQVQTHNLASLAPLLLFVVIQNTDFWTPFGIPVANCRLAPTWLAVCLVQRQNQCNLHQLQQRSGQLLEWTIRKF